jgi:hypothetical protein
MWVIFHPIFGCGKVYPSKKLKGYIFHIIWWIEEIFASLDLF